MGKRVVLALAVIATCLSTVGIARAASLQAQPRLAFWVATGNNGIFDGQILKFISRYSKFTVLNAPITGSADSPDYKEVVNGLQELAPNVPVLLYTWTTRWYGGERSGGSVLSGFPDLGPLLLANPKSHKLIKGRVISKDGQRLLFGDVRNPRYRRWVTKRVSDMLAATGADGVASDMTVRSQFRQFCVKDPGFCSAYGAGVDSLLSSIRSAINPRLLIYNGLWNIRPGQLADQERLLRYADGAEIEFFGTRPDRRIPPFDKGILPFFKVIESHPGKTILVFGRGHWSYTGYKQDYLWQRYLLCAYLLVARDGTLFRYASSFQSQPRGRSGPFTLYEDLVRKLGPPLAPYQVTAGLYSREYADGLVLFVPKGGSSRAFKLSHVMYDATGRTLNGTVNVKSGEGLILYDHPKSADKFAIDFSSFDGGGMFMPRSEIRHAGRRDVLHLKLLPRRKEWEHDLLLDPVKHLNSHRGFRISLRVGDADDSLLVVAEVDDKNRKNERAVIGLSAGSCPYHQAGSKGSIHISFRAPHTRLSYPYYCISNFLHPDGKWHTYQVGRKNLLPERYAIRRWVFARFIGAMDVGGFDVYELRGE